MACHTTRGRARKIFLNFHIGKASIGQMYDQARGSDRPAREQRANGFEDDLVFRFAKNTVRGSFQKRLPLFARRILIAQCAQDLKIGFHRIILFQGKTVREDSSMRDRFR